MIDKLVANIKRTDAPVLVGLDPMLSYIPTNIVNQAIQVIISLNHDFRL